MDECWLPESLYIGLQSLEEIVKEVESLLNDKQYAGTTKEDPLTSEAGENILVENHASVMNGTHLVIQELQQIAMACIKQGESRLAVPPLDPMLHEWISACSANLLRIKKFIHPLEETDNSKSGEEPSGSGDEWLLVEKDDEDRKSPESDNGGISTLGAEEDDLLESGKGKTPDKVDLGLEFASLKDRTISIADFIPILKFQVDEFLADNVSQTPFPNSTTKVRGDGNYSFSPAPSAQNAALKNLRRLLYSLSDEIKACRTRLDSLATSLTLPVDVAADVNSLNAAEEISVKILAELLSNNASEWIDSMLAGKLSFSEFSSLDQEELQEFVQDLRYINEQLGHAVSRRATRHVGVHDADVEALELGIWAQRIKGLNWMLGRRELT